MGAKIAVLLLAAALVAGCGGSKSAPQVDEKATPGASAPAGGAAAGGKADPEDKAAGEDKAKDDDKGKDEDKDKGKVVLTPEERTKLGITASPAQSVTFTPSATGFALVLTHDSVAQVVADLETATSAVHLSQAALTRAQTLASGPGALGVDTLETAQKQASSDRTALTLAQRKLTAVLGVRFPWQGDGDGARGVLGALAAGQSKLIRATFPLGALVGESPKSLRLVPMDPAAGTVAWTASPVWEAPQDATLPGRSFFALIAKADVPEGLRFQAVPGASNSGVPGVLIPASAVVISNGQYWCYVEKPASTFTRVSITIDKPLGQGYFVGDGVDEGDPVVTASAGLLLAREANAGSESAD